MHLLVDDATMSSPVIAQSKVIVNTKTFHYAFLNRTFRIELTKIQPTLYNLRSKHLQLFKINLMQVRDLYR